MKKIIKEFFYSKNKFQPPYFWVTVLMTLIVAIVVLRLFHIGTFSDELTLGMLGLVVAWCGVYNYGKKK